MPVTLNLTDAGVAAVAAAAGSGATVIAELGLTAQAFDFAPTLTRLPGEFKRLASIAGAPAGGNLAYLEALDNSADVWTATGCALYLDDGTLFAAMSADETILAKASLAFALIALDVAFTAEIIDNIAFGDLVFSAPPATTEGRGVIEIATKEEAQDGIDDQRALTPASAAAAVFAWLRWKNVELGTVDVLTPNVGTTGGLRVRANPQTGIATLQFVSQDGKVQCGFFSSSAQGGLVWSGTAGLQADRITAGGSTAWVGNRFDGPIAFDGNVSLRTGADILLEPQFAGNPTTAVYNDRGTLGIKTGEFERVLVGQDGRVHIKGGREFLPEIVVPGSGNLRVWAAQAGGVAYTAMDNADYTALQLMRQVQGAPEQKGAITVTDTGTTYGTTSDYRLKEDLQPITGALDRVRRIKIWDYRWIGTERRSIGYLAHELAEVLPDAVTGEKDAMREVDVVVSPGKRPVWDEDGSEVEPGCDPVIRTDRVPDLQTVDPSRSVPLLTAAVQELAGLLERQSGQITRLQARLRKLEGTA